MEKPKSPREIAEQIVNSADSIAYLGDVLSRGLPGQWRGGPALELRMRFNCPLKELTDADLQARLSAAQMIGPIRPRSLERVGQSLAIEDHDMLPTGSWRPRGFGLWCCSGIPPMGVKVYPSARTGIGLLTGVPQPFLNWATGGFGFSSCVELFTESPEHINSFCKIAAAILHSLKAAQPILRLSAAHLQDQVWCDSLKQSDSGFMVPAVVAQKCGWKPIDGVVRENWVGVALGK